MASRKWFGLLLFPGASATAEASSLVAVDNAAPSNVIVCRSEFPNPRANQAKLLDAVNEAASQFCTEKRIRADRLFLGGRSMGERICSLAVAEGLASAGLVLLSYPLHPPGRPEKLRVDHFPSVAVPTLFVSGTKDTFGTPDELRQHAKQIPGPLDQVWIEGGDHGMKRHDEVVARAVSDWLGSVMQ